MAGPKTKMSTGKRDQPSPWESPADMYIFKLVAIVALRAVPGRPSRDPSGRLARHGAQLRSGISMNYRWMLPAAAAIGIVALMCMTKDSPPGPHDHARPAPLPPRPLP